MVQRLFVLCALMLAPGLAAAQVVASNAWVRAPAPGGTVAAAYLSLTSSGPDALTGANTPAAGMAMLHRSSSAHGMESMEDAPRLPLPAGKTVALKPGGYHIMLMELPAPLVPGSSVTLTLHFLHAKDITVTAPVRPITASGP